MIVVDIETTGLEPTKHSIVSIGAIDFTSHENEFYEECRIWDGAEIDPIALERNGFTEEEIKNPDKKSLKELVAAFLKWTASCKIKVLAGHNVVDLDIPMLKDSLRRYKIKWPFHRRTVDLHSLCYANQLSRGLIPYDENGNPKISLDNVLTYVGLPIEPKPHNGLTGAKMEAECFSRLIYGKPLLPEFSQYKISDYLKQGNKR